MRPHKIFNCILWIFVIGFSFHIIIFILVPYLTNEYQSGSEYLSVSREVKEFKTDQSSLHASLLDKLRYQVFDVFNFTPDPDKGPIPLTKIRRKNVPNEKLPSNYSLYIQNANAMNKSDLLRLLHRINYEQDVLNIGSFPNPEFVIVIQIHNRLEYLTILINCLLSVKDIHKALLVFSHDVYFSEFNILIRSIRFAPVLQIFFPFNQQIFDRQFPGPSKKDCDPKLKKDSPELGNCFNKEWTDSYGNYRNYKYMQTKHHWTWKANFVFERIRVLKNFNNPIIFLEEDHYITEDFLHVLRLMWQERDKKYPAASLLCLGTYEKAYSFNPSNRVQVGSWVSSFHNMGMSFNRTIWLQIKQCVKEFCDFDDYNWDWSLHHIHKRCIQNGFQVMLLKFSPRIYHIGECGIHHKKEVCNPYIILYKIQKLISQNMQYLYPSDISYNGPITVRSKEFKPNGGWSDPRDRKLCKYLLSNSEFLDNVTTIEVLDDHLSILESVLL